MKSTAIPALLALALSTSLTLSTPALAGATVTTSIAVSPAGLDLNTSAGAAAMAQRLDRAALSVCGASKYSLRDYQQAVRRSACYDEAMTQALASLGAPAVNAALARSPGGGV